jgi:hypothetical protein
MALMNMFNSFAQIYLIYNLINYTHNFIIKNYDNEYFQNILIHISYKLIFYYSTCEMYINKYKNILNDYINSNEEFKKIFKIINSLKNNCREEFEFVKNGNVVIKTTKNNLLNQIDNIDYDYDFIIYSDYSNESETINKVLFYNLESLKQSYNNNKINYDIVSYKFIMFEIILNNIPISINLTTEKYNYLIDKNIINQNFIKYFIKKYNYNIFDNFNDEHFLSYKIRIIDNCINVLEFDNNPLLINKTKGISYLNEDKQFDKEIVKDIVKEVYEEIIKEVDKNIEKEIVEFKNNKEVLNEQDYDCVELENYKYN